MYIDSFKVFCDLVETESFSKAAVKNGITQSAVSQQVRNLEVRFGVTLVERGRRQVSLTPEGTAFLEACQKIVIVWENFENQLGVLKNETSGEVIVATTLSLGLYALPKHVQALALTHPEVRVKIRYASTAEVFDLVESGRADAGIVAFPVKRKDVIEDVFGQDELCIVTAPGHPLAKAGTAPLSALAGLSFASFQNDSPTRKFIDKALRDADAKVVQYGEFESVETIKRVVQIENVVSIVPAESIRAEVEAKTLAKVGVSGVEMKRPLSVIVSRVRPRPPGLKELLETLKQPLKA